MKIEAHSDAQKNFTDEQIQRLYLIHHMHHFKDKQEVYHELHHCFLFEGPGMKGEKHTVTHNCTRDELLHVVDNKYTGTLFDHDNNEFSVIDGIISL